MKHPKQFKTINETINETQKCKKVFFMEKTYVVVEEYRGYHYASFL